jgi:site-specific DNA-methyltransferase (adenine-specific)
VAEPIGDVIAWDYTGNILHPTQKPVKPLQKLIETFCPEGGLVLDPFAGSGSTLAAAQLAGRKWLGVELDSGYYEIAHNRLRGMAHGLPLTCEARASAKPVREPAAA